MAGLYNVTTVVRHPNEKSVQKAEQQSPQLEFRMLGKVQPPHSDLAKTELWWYQHYEWLKGHGYLLQPRYSPGWTPSWLESKKSRLSCEDGHPAEFAARLLDATRLSDGTYVVLKRVKKSVHPFEVEIGQFFSSELLAAESENHCVPIYDVLHIPGDEEISIVVMPLLLDYTYPQFDTIGEAVECFRQLFEGLLFMHKHCVAHRDCTSLNVMVDPTSFFVDAPHPVIRTMKRDFSGRARFRTRTQARPKYYLIDFGLSRRYDPSVVRPKEAPIWGADKTVPEFQISDEPRDPFPTDVFYIGNMIREDFIETMEGFDFMRPLIADMIQEDPSKRPTMQEVVDSFRVIRTGLSAWKLRSRVASKDEYLFELIIGGVSHWIRRIKFIMKGIPAVPTTPGSRESDRDGQIQLSIRLKLSSSCNII